MDGGEISESKFAVKLGPQRQGTGVDTMKSQIESFFSLKDRVAVVTGAGSGIGQETVLTLARAGAHVVGVDRDADACSRTSALAKAENLSCEFMTVDVSDREQVIDCGQSVFANHGRVDVWANIAGILQYDLIVDVAVEDVLNIISVNQLGVLWGIASAAKVMNNGGSIVSIASAGGEMPFPRLAAYGMTKAAVMQLTRTAALELGEQGIRVNAIAPGFVDTPMVAANFVKPDGTIDLEKRAEHFATRSQQSPIRATGEPIDIALAVLYLASDSSRFMTGQILRPNGGAFYG